MDVQTFFLLLVCVAGAWFVTQLLKLFWMKRPYTFTQWLFHSGGMPSSHSAIVAALATVIGLYNGLSISFLLAVFFAIIVMRDAMGVRYAVGNNALLLKTILSKSSRKKIVLIEGHTLKQVVVGTLLGVGVSALLFFLFLAL